MSRSQTCFFLVAAICIAGTTPSITSAAPLLYDDFPGTLVNSVKWHIPTWESPTDGTFVGRTQFRCTQNSPLPSARNSNALITIESYNPAGFSFYGTDLISNQELSLQEAGLRITVRAKMDTSAPGIVGGIFLYALKPGSSTLHDEIDFELLTNQPDGVQTNIYGNEPLGVGYPQFTPYHSGTIANFHTYEIQWYPGRVSWFIDGRQVRTATEHVPTGPMYFHLNMWVPDTDWPEAYSPEIQPTSSSGSNQIFQMTVDSVKIQPITPRAFLTPALPLLLLDKRR
ncbi:glycoside hydrolase family 16 protein [Desulfobulbus sp. TB]|nr:glycoside hydrolase family 16 protein [Desulfobulbus sp. TB]